MSERRGRGGRVPPKMNTQARGVTIWDKAAGGGRPPGEALEVSRMQREGLAEWCPEVVRVRLAPEEEYARVLELYFGKIRQVPRRVEFECGLTFGFLLGARPPLLEFVLPPLLRKHWAAAGLAGAGVREPIRELDARVDRRALAADFAAAYEAAARSYCPDASQHAPLGRHDPHEGGGG